MNFIAACFLYHVDEVYAFWMFVHLLESLDMKDVYAHGKFNLFNTFRSTWLEEALHHLQKSAPSK